MLHHVSIGVADVGRAAQFYDAVLATLGYRRVMEFLPYAVAYGEKMPQFWVSMPHDQNVPSAGNGAHIAFTANNAKSVDAFHAAAIGAGAKDEGAPGPRPEYTKNYYGAFVRDPDGNKIEAVFLPMSRASQPKTRAPNAKPNQPRKPPQEGDPRQRRRRHANRPAAKPVRGACRLPGERNGNGGGRQILSVGRR